ncbi:type II toxin-antitoxin system Phd/YefM family antitoxin [Patescibacteria group bacterium]|nr:type II toxin-antitoxin system Phd/YefM family antitoxin [Patescibacteria group bacterium]
MINLIAISDVRMNLPDLVTSIHANLDRAIITVNGKPKVAMVSIDELESLEETAEVLMIPNIKKTIKRSRAQIKKGEYTSLSDLS